MHFVIERLLNGSIPDQDEVTKFEVIFDNGGGMLLLKVDHSFDPCGLYIGGKHCEVRLTFLQGDSTPSDQVGQGKMGIGWRKKVSCFSNMEGQKWVCASGCKVWGTAHMSSDCDMVSSHDGGNY